MDSTFFPTQVRKAIQRRVWSFLTTRLGIVFVIGCFVLTLNSSFHLVESIIDHRTCATACGTVEPGVGRRGAMLRGCNCDGESACGPAASPC